MSRTWWLSLCPQPGLTSSMIRLEIWNVSVIRIRHHPRRSIIMTRYRTPTFQIIHRIWQEDNTGGSSQMAHEKWIIDSGHPIRSSDSKWISQRDVDKSPGNESLLPHRTKNAQILLVIFYLPLFPNAQCLPWKTVPLTNHPAQTTLWSKTRRMLMVSIILSRVIP